jgi:hypothetical protein
MSGFSVFTHWAADCWRWIGLEVPDILVVRPVSIVRMSHSVPVESMEVAAEQVRMCESSQPEVITEPSRFTCFAQCRSLPNFFPFDYTAAARRESRHSHQPMTVADSACRSACTGAGRENVIPAGRSNHAVLTESMEESAVSFLNERQ